MAFLKVIEGDALGKVYEITGERVVFGRHPNCDIVLGGAGVSRHHAQIVQVQGQYCVEDLRSRNGTFLNQAEVEGRRELDDSDIITFCESSFRFSLKPPEDDSFVTQIGSGRPQSARKGDGKRSETRAAVADEAGRWNKTVQDESEGTSIISTVSAESSSKLRLNINPEAKLKAVLEISRVLARTLDLDQVLEKILEALFRIFPQADEGFVMLRDVETNKLKIRASRVRHAKHDDVVRISTTIVRKAIESGEGILSANASEDSRFSTSESIDGLQIKSMICAPLLGGGSKALGVIQIATWDLRQQFSDDDLDLLISVASQACLAIENAYLHERALIQRDLERELEFAMQVQIGFLPKKRPKLPDYQFFDYYEAAQRVGGDFFDYITLSDGRIAVAVADVAGKGVPAALLMARLYSSTRFHLLTKSGAAEALLGLNQELTSGGLGHRFVTFVLAVIDPTTHEVTLANAGHLPPMRRTMRREVQLVARKDSGMPLGITPDQTFREVRFQLDPGDALVFYTDGVTEAMNGRREIYGSRRLRDFVAEAPEGIADVIEGIVSNVETFSEGRAQSDDMCLVGLSRSA